MRTAGLMMNDVWASRVLNARGVEAYQYEGQEADIRVFIDQIDLLPHGREKDGAPYLHLSGDLQWIEPLRSPEFGQEGLPFGIDRVTYTGGTARVDAFYEFTQDQYTELVARKGYFTGKCKIPDGVTNTPWEFPAIVDSLVVAPEKEGDQPLVFCNIRDMANLPLTKETSGYEMVDIFPDVIIEDSRDHEAGRESDRQVQVRTDQMTSIFSQDEIEEGLVTDEPEVPETVDEPGVSAELAAAQADIEAQAEALRREREAQEGTTENLYAQRVAGIFTPETTTPVEKTPKPTPRHREVAPIGPVDDATQSKDLDFGE